MIVLPDGKDIVDVIAGKPGPKSDINLFRRAYSERESHSRFDSKQKFSGDKAYEGEECIKTPKKKPKKQELTPEQKEKNKELAAVRIFVEHIIRLVKIFRVVQERFRLKSQKYVRAASRRETNNYDYLWAGKISDWHIYFLAIKIAI